MTLPTLSDEEIKTMSFEERVGLAYCRLNAHEWDEILGEEPENAEETRRIYTAGLREIIGAAAASRYWWQFNLHRPKEEWLRWYLNERMILQKQQQQSPKLSMRGLLTKILSFLKPCAK